MTDLGRSPARRGPRPTVKRIAGPPPALKPAGAQTWLCLTSADWHHAKRYATKPGSRIVVASTDSRRATKGLLYTVDGAGRLRGPEKVHRLTPYSEWIATT